MARRNQNLAGLAALGALGYMLRDKGAPVEDRVGVDVVRPSAPVPAVDTRDFGLDYSESPNRGGDFMSDKEPGWESAIAPARSATVRSTPAPVRPVAAGPQGRSYSAADAQRMREDFYERNKNNPAMRPAEEPGLENLSGDLLPIGRFGKMLGRGVQSARGALATRAVEETPVTFLGKSGARAMGDAGRLESSAARQLGSEPGKLASEPGKLTGPSKRQLVERDRAARAAAREAEKEAFNRRGVDRFMDSTFEGGMKKGGKVKAKPAKKMASGGATRSSASKRADGIATKGKTRGKLY